MEHYSEYAKNVHRVSTKLIYHSSLYCRTSQWNTLVNMPKMSIELAKKLILFIILQDFTMEHNSEYA